MVRSAILALALVPLVAAINFTGDVQNDFVRNLRNDFPVVQVEDPSGRPDVGVPSQIGDDVSGWDIDSIYWQYNPDTDVMAIGIDCYVICGDADGDGNPDRASQELVGIGGEDTADLSGSESFAIAIDWTPSATTFDPEVIIGIPGGNPPGGQPLACDSDGAGAFSLASCFGLYEFAANLQNVAPAFRFFRILNQYTTDNRNPRPSNVRPDLEFTINGIEQIKRDFGSPFVQDRGEAYDIRIQAFAGSFVDAGIGEDYIPNRFDSVIVPFPCVRFDACDVCLGDGSTCADCAGVPNGNNVIDACGECGGDGSACADCRGIPNGRTEYDECGLCGGDGSTCIPDCLGTPGGRATYDVCNICDGDGSSCLDCLRVPNGNADYDQCDVCAGDGRSCLDCAGVPFGLAEEDECGVCGGDGSSCIETYFGQPTGRGARNYHETAAEQRMEGMMDRMLSRMATPEQQRSLDAMHKKTVLSSRGHEAPSRNADYDVESLIARDYVRAAERRRA